jgi:hypothetical protein
MLRFLLAGLVAAAALSSVPAQQLEVNDAGGSLTRASLNPSPGCPFVVDPNTGTIDFRVSGGVGSGYILTLGVLAGTSVQYGILDNQYFDLATSSVIVVGDGIGLTGPLPPALFVTNALGNSDWSVPANPLLNGATLAFQAIVFDPAHTLGLNITAAAAYYFGTKATGTPNAPLGTQISAFAADDGANVITLATPITFYGTAYSQICVITNGYIRFASGPTGTGLANASYLESNAEFVAGTPSGAAAAPMIAVGWEDLDLSAPGMVQVYEDTTPGAERVTVRWGNGIYYLGSAFGTMDCIIDINGNGAGAPRITLDYAGYVWTGAPSEGIVGVSDGLAASGADVGVDYFCYSPNPAWQGYVSSPGETIFQNFDGTGATPVQPIDVAGSMIIFDDIAGNGTWLLSLL